MLMEHYLQPLRARSTLLCGVLILLTAFQCNAQSLKVGGTGSAMGTVSLLAKAYSRYESRHEGRSGEVMIVPNLGSSGALRALKAGAIDAALISRPLKPDEAAAGLVAYEYGRSPFVFVTNKPGVTNITASTAADYLSGRSTSWPDGQPVRFVMRPESDGDNAYIAALAPGIAQALAIAHKRPGMVVAATDQDAAAESERLPGSLAVNTLALILSERRKLHVLAFNGVTPSPRALATGAYPHYKPLLIVTRGAPRGALQAFVDFFKSPEGRAILEANGHFVSR